MRTLLIYIIFAFAGLSCYAQTESENTDTVSAIDTVYIYTNWKSIVNPTHYYYNGDTIEVAQPSTFKVLGGGYAKDGYSAYYKGKEVQGAQGASFRWVAGDTAADVMDTYIKGEQQPLKSNKQ